MKLHEVKNYEDRDKIISQLKELKIDPRDVFIYHDGTVDARNTITFKDLDFEEMPIKWATAEDGFNITNCENLTSLKNFPTKVLGDFSIKNCDSLISLEGCPKSIGNFLSIVDCPVLKNLKGTEDTSVSTGVIIQDCALLETLEYFPKKITGTLNFDSLPSLKSFGNLHRDDITILSIIELHSITSLEGCPISISKSLFVQNCDNLKSLKGIPKYIGASCQLVLLPKLESFDELPMSIRLFISLREIHKPRNYLAFLKIKNVTEIRLHGEPEIMKIINKYKTGGDIIDCQEELIESGFKDYARLR